jgi:hypothetical protein
MASSRQSGGWRDYTQVRLGRSFFLSGLGALIGLGLAGYALFTARGTSTLVVPAEDVALVNQQPISRSDYLGQLQTLYGVDLQHATAAEREKTLDDMIREELFVQRGKELDLASTDPDVRAALVNAVELEIAADAITDQPTEAALRVYYGSHRERYAGEGLMSLHDLVFPANERTAAAQAVEILKTQAPNPALLAQLHAKESGKGGEDVFYFAAKIHLGERLFAEARALPAGGISAPIEMPDGLHVLYMLKNKTPIPFDFATARDQVLNDYRNDSIRRLRAGDETFLRKRANIQIADDMR